VAGDEDDRDRLLLVAQLGLQIQAAGAPQSEVEDQAGRAIDDLPLEERSGRGKRHGLETDRAEQTDEGATDALVVVYDVHHSVLGHRGTSLPCSASNGRPVRQRLRKSYTRRCERAGSRTGSVIVVALNIVLVIAIHGIFGVETTTLAALMAAAGVAIGMAWSGLFSNFATGAFLPQQHFRVQSLASTS
jgi:hypothetical protein